MMYALLPLFTMSTPALADHPPGAVLESAVTVDATDQGLDAFVPIVENFIPGSIDIPEFSDAVCEEQCLPFPLNNTCFCWYEYEYAVTNGAALITLDNANITPGNGELLLDADLTVQLNSAANPIDVFLFGEIIEVISISEDCDAWVEPFQVQLTGSIGLEVDSATGQLDATIPPLDWQWTLTSDDFQLSNCGTVTTIQDFLEFFGVDIFGLVLDFVEPEIAGAIEGLTEGIEEPIEEAFDAASISEEFELLGVVVSVDVAPTDIEITPDGLRLHLDGSVDAPPDPCVAEYGVFESFETPSTLSPIGYNPPGAPFAPMVSVHADDDLVNQALFSLWNGGLLCQTIDDNFEILPIPIDTSLLDLVSPDGTYDELFPDTEPMALVTRPRRPPIASSVGANDLNVDVEDLGLAFYGEFEGRTIRIMELDLVMEAGVDILFDGTNGSLGVDAGLTADDITATMVYNELTSDVNGEIEQQLAGVVEAFSAPLLGNLLSSLSFTLPTFESIGLEAAHIAPSGSANDRLGVFGTIGTVGYTGASCDGSGGCVGSGCDGGGCSTGSMPGPLAMLLFPLVVAGLRRRDPAR